MHQPPWFLDTRHWALISTVLFAPAGCSKGEPYPERELSSFAQSRFTTATSLQAGPNALNAVEDRVYSNRKVPSRRELKSTQHDISTSQRAKNPYRIRELDFCKTCKIHVPAHGQTWTPVRSVRASANQQDKNNVMTTDECFVCVSTVNCKTYCDISLYKFHVAFDSSASNAPASPMNALATDWIFAPSSFWYTKIPLSVPLHPNSAGFTADFQRQIKAYYGNVTVNASSYSSPVFIAPAGAPTKSVQFWDCQGKRYTDANIVEQWSAVPIPASAEPSPGTDGEMTVFQPSTNTIWEFWRMRNRGGQWQACWGGQLKEVKRSQGIWPKGYGTTATGLPFLGGQITAEELIRGEIRHAIGIALVEVEDSSVFSWPANRSDGHNPHRAPHRIAQGQRFRLDPSIDVDSLKIHPVAKVIAKAAQRYGFVVWDKAGAISLRVQNSNSYTSLGKADPYKELFNGTAEYALLNGFPWDRLQFLPMNYGRP